jgi:hypothetical protein
MIYHDETKELEVPLVRSLGEFRAWAASASFPTHGRIDYISGDIEVDMSPEDLYTHVVPHPPPRRQE